MDRGEPRLEPVAPHGGVRESEGDHPPSGAGRPGMVLAAMLIVALAFGGGIAIGQATAPGATPGSLPGTGSRTARPDASPPPPTPTAGQSSPAGTSPATSPVTETPTASPPPSAGPAVTLPPDAPADIGLFWEALQVIRERYVDRDALAEKELTYGAIEGIVNALGDVGHSAFLTPEDLSLERDALGGTFVGIGIILGERNGRPLIVSVLSGSPAQRAGLRPGDVIVEVGGEEVIDRPPTELVPLIRGEEGTSVRLRLLRPRTDETIDVSVVREEIEIPAASWAFVPGTRIADLRFIQFSEGSSEQLRAALDEAISRGARALILDLRSNPGGFVHEAVESASLFIEDGTVYVRETASDERIPVAVVEETEATELPMVVLIDGGTASSAEILSGAIKASDRGELVGQTTYGTGTVLNTIELSDGSALRLAVERWLTPEGESMFLEGIDPTIEVELGPDDRAIEPDELRTVEPEELEEIGDPQLLRAVELLRGSASGVALQRHGGTAGG